jgi:hypothetical protein
MKRKTKGSVVSKSELTFITRQTLMEKEKEKEITLPNKNPIA